MIQEAPPLAFPSLAELQEAHDALLQARDLQGDATPAPPDFWARVAAFVAHAEASGALIDLSRDRRAVQSILDYWANALYRANQPTPAARLADFDPLLAPELPAEPCPYQGLAAFGQDQQAFFFGRAGWCRKWYSACSAAIGCWPLPAPQARANRRLCWRACCRPCAVAP